MQGYNLVSPSSLFKEDVYQSNYNNLGLSFDQSIWKRINVSLKVSNLLNSPVIRTVRNEGLPVEKSFNYQSYYIGLKFNL
jgi:hypothetical protein